MTTTTARTPLTAADVRQAFEDLEAAAPNDRVDRPIEELAVKAFDLIDWRPGEIELAKDDPDREEHGAYVFHDLRPSEHELLIDIIAEHRDRAERRIRELLIEELTAAALAFAAECPGTVRPRGVG